MVELPRNRKQLFGYLVRRWDAIMSVSLLVALFSVPLVVIVLATSVIKANISLQMSQATFNEQLAVYVLRLLRTQTVGGALSVVGFYPLCLGLNGAFCYYKKTVWSQGGNIKDDFWSGVKDGLKQSILPAVLGALTYLFFVSARWFIQANLSDTASIVIAYVVVAAVVTFVASICLLDIAQNQIYRCSVWHRFKNSAIMALLYFPHNFLFVAMALLPIILMVILPQVAGLSIAFVVYAVYYFGFTSLAWTLHSHSIFDKCINAKSYPQLVGKGLHKTEKSSNNSNL